MTYATVMVNLQLGRSNAALVQVAGDLAERFGAGVIGIAACQPMQIVYGDAYVPPNLIDTIFGDNDLKALAASSLGLLSWDGVDPKIFHLPSFHYAGEKDPLLPVARRAAEAMAGAEFRMLPGLNHLSAFAQSRAVLPLALAFLEKHAHRA